MTERTIVDVTCLMPVYNRPDYVVASIQSILDQTVRLKEVIVIDDGSTDDTPEVLESFGDQIRVIRKGHSGISETLNVGLEHVTTEYVAMLDSDDLWLPDKTEKQLAALVNSEAQMCFCQVEQFVSDDLKENEKAKLQASLAPVRGFTKIALLTKKSVFDTVGGFNPDIDTGDFIEWYGRAKSANISEVVVPEVLCKRRMHLGNFMRGDEKDMQQYAQILRAHLLRKRKNKS